MNWKLEKDDGCGTKYYQVTRGDVVVDSAVCIHNAGSSWYNGDGTPYVSETAAKKAWESKNS